MGFNVEYGGGVVDPIYGSTSGGSTCMVIDICFEHGFAAPSVATMTTWNDPTVSGDTSDDIRPDEWASSRHRKCREQRRQFWLQSEGRFPRCLQSSRCVHHR